VTSGPPSDGDPRVIDFRTRRANAPGAKATGRGADDLAPYARAPDDPAEYRHRMMVNAAALVFVVALIGVAIWLADTMAEMRRNQDCVLSGRRGCTPVEYERSRWSSPSERPSPGPEAPPPRQP
jgi:hypothetical protein